VRPPSSQGANALLKVLGTAFLALLLVAIIGAYLGFHFLRHTRLEANGKKVRIQSPAGTIETNVSPEEVARQSGIEIYPGARPLDDNSAVITAAGTHTLALTFETSDPPDKVADFYKSKFPNANVTSSEGDHHTIVVTNKKQVLTVNIEPAGDMTHIQISSVGGTNE
jgi:hypothetical protein